MTLSPVYTCPICVSALFYLNIDTPSLFIKAALAGLMKILIKFTVLMKLVFITLLHNINSTRNNDDHFGFIPDIIQFYRLAPNRIVF